MYFTLLCDIDLSLLHVPNSATQHRTYLQFNSTNQRSVCGQFRCGALRGIACWPSMFALPPSYRTGPWPYAIVDYLTMAQQTWSLWHCVVGTIDTITIPAKFQYPALTNLSSCQAMQQVCGRTAISIWYLVMDGDHTMIASCNVNWSVCNYMYYYSVLLSYSLSHVSVIVLGMQTALSSSMARLQCWNLQPE